MQVLRTTPRSRRIVREPSQLVLKPLLWREQGLYPGAGVSTRCPKRLLLSYVLFAVGTGLCTYVAGSYALMYAEQVKLLHQWKQQNANSDGNLAKLSIPRIHLRAVVLEGTSADSLLLGPAHVEGTAAPGTSGNVVLAGHRDTFFRHVHSLRYGDDIYIMKSGTQAHYRVRSRKIVEPTDLSVLRPSPDDEVTLITCYPTHAIGPAPQRLIIVAKRVKGI